MARAVQAAAKPPSQGFGATSQTQVKPPYSQRNGSGVSPRSAERISSQKSGRDSSNRSK